MSNKNFKSRWDRNKGSPKKAVLQNSTVALTVKLFDSSHRFNGESVDTRFYIEQLEAYARTIPVPYYYRLEDGNLVEKQSDEKGWTYSAHHMLMSKEMCQLVAPPVIPRATGDAISEDQLRKIRLEMSYVELDTKSITKMNEKRSAASTLVIKWIYDSVSAWIVQSLQKMGEKEQLTPFLVFHWLKETFAETSHLENIMAERRLLYGYCEATSMAALKTTLMGRLATFHGLPSSGPEMEEEAMKEQYATLMFHLIMDSIMPEKLNIHSRYRKAYDLLIADSKVKEMGTMCELLELFSSKCEIIEREHAVPVPVLVSVSALAVAPVDEGGTGTSTSTERLCFRWQKYGTCKFGDSCKFKNSHTLENIPKSGRGGKESGGKKTLKRPRCTEESPCALWSCSTCKVKGFAEFKNCLHAEENEAAGIVEGNQPESKAPEANTSVAKANRRHQRLIRRQPRRLIRECAIYFRIGPRKAKRLARDSCKLIESI